ncbi:hypothetical protein [Niabella ginsenosidivorans]|nr:hypothetical protein [Niabella ginsenosidivorans]
MHHKTGQTEQQKETEPQTDCCKEHSSKHQQHQHRQNGHRHCNNDNCTNNLCHPVSVSSLHAEETIEIVAPSEEVAQYVIRSNDMPLFSYTYSIWQPPRLG